MKRQRLPNGGLLQKIYVKDPYLIACATRLCYVHPNSIFLVWEMHDLPDNKKEKRKISSAKISIALKMVYNNGYYRHIEVLGCVEIDSKTPIERRLHIYDMIMDSFVEAHEKCKNDIMIIESRDNCIIFRDYGDPKEPLAIFALEENNSGGNKK